MNSRQQQTIGFLGTGDAFSDHPNNAYFYTESGTLVFIDLDTRNFPRAKRLITGLSPKHICVLVTHMHNDHVSGIPTLIEWVYYVHWREYAFNDGAKDKKLHICAPYMLLHNIQDELYRNRLIGGNMVIYNTVDTLKRNGSGVCAPKNGQGGMALRAIPTLHVGGYFHHTCFGYYITVGGRTIVYSGDTATLAPFGGIPCDEFYCEISTLGGERLPHLSWNEEKETLFGMAADRTVFLMHADGDARERIQGEAEAHGIYFAAETDFHDVTDTK